MSKTIRFAWGGSVTRSYQRGHFVFNFDVDGVLHLNRSEILQLVNLLLTTPTTDPTFVDNCPQCSGPIDTEKSVTMVLTDGRIDIIACHACTIQNAKRATVPTHERTHGYHLRCRYCGAFGNMPCKL